MATMQERLEAWEAEYERLHRGGRWGECRRFAGRSAGIRLARIDWLRQHIAEAKVRLETET